MKLERVIEVLVKHQAWRRDQNVPSTTEMQNPFELGEAIDYAIEELKKSKISLRDKFAMEAMNGELASQSVDDRREWANEKDLAERAYSIADAMMEHRNKNL